MLYRCPVENETAVGLLNRMGLFSRGVFRSLIDNGVATEEASEIAERRVWLPNALRVIFSILNSHSPNFVFSAALTAISFLPRELAFIGPSLPPCEFWRWQTADPFPSPELLRP